MRRSLTTVIFASPTDCCFGITTLPVQSAMVSISVFTSWSRNCRPTSSSVGAGLRPEAGPGPTTGGTAGAGAAGAGPVLASGDGSGGSSTGRFMPPSLPGASVGSPAGASCAPATMPIDIAARIAARAQVVGASRRIGTWVSRLMVIVRARVLDEAEASHPTRRRLRNLSATRVPRRPDSGHAKGNERVAPALPERHRDHPIAAMHS